jgi:hypothetical protein
METIELENGKYVLHFDGTKGTLIADRHGCHCWRDMTGDGMVLAMMQRIQDLEEYTESLESINENLILCGEGVEDVLKSEE